MANPHRIQARRWLECARQCQGAGQFAEAEALSRRALEVQPNDREVLHLLAVLAHQRGDKQGAAEFLSQAIAADSSSAVLYAQLGTVLRELGALERAEACYRRALELAPDVPDHYNELGNVLRLLGRGDDAARSYQKGLAVRPRHPVLLNNLANTRREAGRFEEAFDLYRQALAIDPRYTDAVQNMANLLKEQGRISEALPWFEKLLALKPESVDAYLSAGAALQSEGKLEEAIRVNQKILALRPDCAPAHNNLASIWKQQGKLDEARASLARAIALDPNLVIAHVALAAILREQELPAEALRTLECALALEPGNAEIQINAGNLYCELQRLDEGIRCYEKALALNPDSAAAHNNLGNTLRDKERIAEAGVHLRKALELAPDFPDAHSNLANALKDQGRFAEAVASYEKAIELLPDHAGYVWNKALAELSAGDLEQGWADYEAGFACKQRQPERPFDQPRWEGQSLTGKTVLAWGEQGIGDQLMFASCLPDLAARADRCIVECDPRLIALFTRSFQDCEMVPQTKPPRPRTAWPDVDYQIPTGSLARWLRPSVESFPRDRGYLLADPARVAHWRARLAELGTGLKVGISWRSSIMTANRLKHIVPLERWGPILTVPGLRFVNMQYCDYQDDLAAAERDFGARVHVFDGLNLRDDLDEVAALTTALDLTITIGNYFMSLAGGVNTETWLFALQDNLDWVNLGVDYAPWYPSVRFFYRRWDQKWDVAVEAMARELARRAGV